MSAQRFSPDDAEIEAIVGGIHGKTPEATQRERARLRAEFAKLRLSPRERYRAEVAGLGPDQKAGRRLAFANIGLVLAGLLAILIPITINTAVRVASGGTPLDPDCLADHTRRYCYLLATRGDGTVDLPGWLLLPFAAASAVLMVLVWPEKRHYFAVKPSRLIVVIVASPIWFGIGALMLAAFTAVFTWTFTAAWAEWAAEFLPAVAIWTVVGVVGVVAGALARRS